MWPIWIWLREHGKKHPNKCMCLILKYNSTINCTTERPSENWRVRARLWIEISGPSPADTHAGRSQAHHVARVCPEPPSSNDTFAHTFIFIRICRETRDERRRGGSGRREILPLSHSLFVPPSPGGQLPSPLTGAPSPSSLPLSLALLHYNSRNICL